MPDRETLGENMTIVKLLAQKKSHFVGEVSNSENYIEKQLFLI